MEILVSSLIAAILASALGAAINLLISRSLRGKTKEIMIKKTSGEFEQLYIDALANDDQVLRAVQNTLEFEHDVYEAIKKLQFTYRNLSAHQGHLVDFVAEYNNLKLAIECKLVLDRLNEEVLNKYLGAEDRLDKLLFLTRAPVTPKIREFINASRNRDRVAFVSIADGSNLSESVATAIKKELLISQLP
jgi:hypothetical protein